MGCLQACGRLSEGSGRTTNFYELDAQVKGMASLEQSLVGHPHVFLVGSLTCDMHRWPLWPSWTCLHVGL